MNKSKQVTNCMDIRNWLFPTKVKSLRSIQRWCMYQWLLLIKSNLCGVCFLTISYLYVILLYLQLTPAPSPLMPTSHHAHSWLCHCCFLFTHFIYLVFESHWVSPGSSRWPWLWNCFLVPGGLLHGSKWIHCLTLLRICKWPAVHQEGCGPIRSIAEYW